MQKLGLEIVRVAKKEKMQKLEDEMKDAIDANKEGAIFICPYCQYESKKNPKGSAKVFKNEFFKCFSCGKWRKI